jgi:hypothetical protein
MVEILVWKTAPDGSEPLESTSFAMAFPPMPIVAIRPVLDAFICPRFTQLVASRCGLHRLAKPGKKVVRDPPSQV